LPEELLSVEEALKDLVEAKTSVSVIAKKLMFLDEYCNRQCKEKKQADPKFARGGYANLKKRRIAQGLSMNCHRCGKEVKASDDRGHKRRNFLYHKACIDSMRI
jgi:hypothetical protein